ncbi:MAG TPA: imidazoleglycerol-phosphate dehydratase [Candidatus Acidoferrum sp.]|nr:imidazoleglycerol-phosphate dehydratase [Candidatus Acidoferrum sp.]
MSGSRAASRQRRTTETAVTVRLALDGRGSGEIATGVPFLDHLLRALAVHGRLDLDVSASGDLEVDAHHTVEDVALVLGETFAEALGDRMGIARFGDATVPLDEARSMVAVDCGGRGYAVIDVPLQGPTLGTLPASLLPHFLETLALRGGLTLHAVASGRDDHHIAEATFKALARALCQACALDPTLAGRSATTK